MSKITPFRVHMLRSKRAAIPLSSSLDHLPDGQPLARMLERHPTFAGFARSGALRKIVPRTIF